ncbi:unnamed protein product [Moneuplotes crassus]|uniref:Enoyl reductase (ER) domain-containing protein n=1 Tax=Euplotes crassus TaxID=5936 RepID=A0AAD1XL75_EUPCR|nr:unnamed protein product [Moneuplotes crassus]
MEAGSDYASGTKFRAVVTDFKKPTIAELELREIQDDELLIKVHSTPVHFADQGYCRGLYGNKEDLPPPPSGVGFEGAGEIVKVGANIDSSLVGRKAAFTNSFTDEGYQGTFRQYIYLPHSRVIVYPEGCTTDYDVLSCAVANPLTICGFIDYCQKNGHTSVIHDAASGACGKLFLKACKKFGIKLINLVRKDEQVTMLNEMGADVTLNYSSEEFPGQLTEAINEHKPTAYFTALAGEVAAYVFGQMDRFTTLYIYGMLSMENISLEPKNILFKSQRVESFWLTVWLSSLTKEEVEKWNKTILDDISKDEGTFSTPIGKIFKLEEVLDAMRHARKSGSEGKTILRAQE